MESLIEFLNALNTLTPVAVIALLGLAIFFLVWKNPFKPVEDSLNEVKENHLHDLPSMAANVEKMVEILQRIEVKMGEDDIRYVRRIDGVFLER